MAHQGWIKLGVMLRRRRKTRRMNQAQFAEATGISLTNVSNIERGAVSGYDPTTVDLIEQEMGWHSGSVDSVVGGGEPFPKDDPAMARLRTVWERLTPAAREALVDFIQLATEK